MGTKGAPSRREVLLSNPDLRAWWSELGLRSRITADVNLRQLTAFLRETGLDAKQLVQLSKRDRQGLRRRLVRYAHALGQRGRLASYIAKTFVGVKSWLRFNQSSFNDFPKLRVIQGASLLKERTPTPEELRRILSVLSPRGRVIALMMAHAGVRPGALGNIDSTGGLCLRDFPELGVEKTVEFSKVPFLIRVPAERSKTAVSYVTFGGGELAEAILAYLSDRRSRGQTLSPDSPLITVAPGGAANYKRKGKETPFVTTKAISAELRVAIRKVLPEGVEWRPYVLRAYCSTQLWLAGNHGKIDRDAREAILGHDLGVSGRYNLRKRLHPEIIEELREAYRRAEPYLSTSKPIGEPSETDLKKAILGVFLTPEEVALVDVTTLSAEEVRMLVAEKMRGVRESASGMGGGLGPSAAVPQESLDPMLAAPPSPSLPQLPDGFRTGGFPRLGWTEEVVPRRAVKTRLAKGWTWVASLGQDEAILRKPL